MVETLAADHSRLRLRTLPGASSADEIADGLYSSQGSRDHSTGGAFDRQPVKRSASRDHTGSFSFTFSLQRHSDICGPHLHVSASVIQRGLAEQQSGGRHGRAFGVHLRDRKGPRQLSILLQDWVRAQSGGFAIAGSAVCCQPCSYPMHMLSRCWLLYTWLTLVPGLSSQGLSARRPVLAHPQQADHQPDHPAAKHVPEPGDEHAARPRRLAAFSGPPRQPGAFRGARTLAIMLPSLTSRAPPAALLGRHLLPFLCTFVLLGATPRRRVYEHGQLQALLWCHRLCGFYPSAWDAWPSLRQWWFRAFALHLEPAVIVCSSVTVALHHFVLDQRIDIPSCPARLLFHRHTAGCCGCAQRQGHKRPVCCAVTPCQHCIVHLSDSGPLPRRIFTRMCSRRWTSSGRSRT